MRPSLVCRSARLVSTCASHLASRASRARASAASRCVRASATLPEASSALPATLSAIARAAAPSPGVPLTTEASSTPTLNGPRKLSAAQAPSRAPAASSAAPRNRALLAEPRKVPAVPCLGGGERRRAAPGEAPFGAQMLRRVLLDAHQHVEPRVAHLPYERLVEQRLH